MGHLTRIANSIVHNSDKGPNGVQIQQLISGLSVYSMFIKSEVFLQAVFTHPIRSLAELPEEDRERWESFSSGQLADTNKKNTVDLVRVLACIQWFCI